MRDHLSYSQISMYLTCGMSYYYRYCENIVSPPGIALLKGSAVHKGIERNNLQKIVTRKDLKKKDIVDMSVAALDDRIKKEGLFLDDEEKTIGKKQIIGKAKDSIVSIGGLYADEVAPTIMPTRVEHTVDIDIPDSLPVRAVMDCIDDQKNIHDYKVTGRSKNQGDVDNSLQLTFYAMAYKQEFGELPNGLSFDCLVETKVPKYQRLETKRDESIFLKMFRYVKAVEEGISKEVFLPAQEGSWKCSSLYCGYHSMCKFVNNKAF